jgi:hypothetical protein
LATRTIVECDGCHKELTQTKETYHIDVKTNRFWNVVEMDYLSKRLQFCPNCASDLLSTCKKIVAMLSKEQDACGE